MAEKPRVTYPFSDAAWTALDALVFQTVTPRPSFRMSGGASGPLTTLRMHFSDSA